MLGNPLNRLSINNGKGDFATDILVLVMGKEEWEDVVNDKHEETEEDYDDVDEDTADDDHATSTDVASRTLSDHLNKSVIWLDKLCRITPTTKKGQNIYMACMLIIPLLPIIALITQNIILLTDVIKRKSDLIDSDASVERSDEASRLVLGLQKERSETLFSLFIQNNIETQRDVGLDLKKRFAETDFALENISNWRSPKGEEMFRSKLRFQIRLDDFRKLVVNETDSSELVVEDAMDFYTYATKVLLDDISNIIRSSNGSSTWRYLITYKNLLRAIESVEIEMSYGMRFQARGNLTRKNFAKFIEHHKLSQEYLLQGETFLTTIRDELKTLRMTKFFKTYKGTYRTLKNERSIIFPNETVKIDRILNYYTSTVGFLNQLRQVIADIRLDMKEIVNSEISSVEREYVFGIFVLALLFLISPMIVFLIRNAVRALQIFSSSVKSKVFDLKRERRKGKKLIHQMLPKSVADSLKSNKETSEMFESVTVCFTEIDSFKDVARRCSALELFDLLNIIYETYDTRIENYDVYKAERINDSYMVASGLPERNGDQHAAEIANLCLDLLLITPGILIPHNATLRLKVRIGVHTGPVTAGVVGSKMPRYCLFGETISMAASMRSTGEPMKIQMSYETKIMLDTMGGYISERREQEVEMKGKGLLESYWLVSRA